MRSAVILVGKERQTKMMSSHMVPYKGAGTQWVTALLGCDLRNLGIANSSTIVLKSDQEPALVDLLKDVQRWRVERNSRATTTIEHSSVHDSKSNGFVERGVRSFEQIFRTHKLDLERKVGKGVDVHLPVMAWLAEHVADMYTIRAMSSRMERRLMRNFGEESTKAKCCLLDVRYFIASLVSPSEELWPQGGYQEHGW